jgi:activator of HSP90 ATPase
VPGRLIVQAWRASNWKKRDLDSTPVLVFTRAPGGGRIAMTHVNVPDANAARITRGWSEYYWKPLRTCLKRPRKGDRR